MVSKSHKLNRVLHVRQQKARLFEFELQKIDTAIGTQIDLIASAEHSITAAAEQAADGVALTTRSAWLKQTQAAISSAKETIAGLKQERVAVETARQQLERQSEALSRYLSEQEKLQRRERQRVEQIKLNEVLTARGQRESTGHYQTGD